MAPSLISRWRAVGPCLSTIVLCALTLAACGWAAPEAPRLPYPVAQKGDVVDDYAGSKVPDPYRWMEALDSKDVADWVAASNAVTDPYLATLPLREHFNSRLTELWNYPRVSVPVIEGGKLFYAKNAGLQRQAPIYVRDRATAPPTLVIDPNEISEDGSVSLSQWMPSPDGKLLAYGLAEGGADWTTVHVRDMTTGKDLSDEVRWMRFSNLSWTNDGKGFFYSRYPEPPKNKVLEAALSGQALYYHRVGTPQSQDTLVYERKDLASWIINGDVTEDGRYLLISMYEGAENKNSLYYADLGSATAPRVNAPVKPLMAANDAEYWPIGNTGTTLYLRTDKDASNRKVIAVDVQSPAPGR